MTRRIELEQRIDASRDTLWEACSTASGLAGWQADEASVDLRDGGRVQLAWPEALGAVVELEVERVVPGVRVEMSIGSNRVVLNVLEQGVRLVHEGLSPEDDVEGFESSWRVALAVLAHGLERHPGRSRSVGWQIRVCATTPGAAYLHFVDSYGLAQWLAREGEIRAVGSEYSLTLPGGESMSGRVLVRDDGRDVAVSWEEEHDALLVLRTLPAPTSPDERIVALNVSSWHPGSDARTLAGKFSKSMARLEASLKRGGRA